MQPDYISSDKATIRFFNTDNMVFMQDVPDKYFDIAICDPPYGINHVEKAGKQSGTITGKAAAKKGIYKSKTWDKNIPDKYYFTELFRVSKNQIIWGANNMTEYLPNSTGWIFWDKDNYDNNFSDGELAFSSFNKGLRKYKFTWNGMIQENMKNKEIRIHVNQKPVQLYRWLLQNYAKPGQKIFDSHGGSMSSAIACDMEGFDLDIVELDPEYFKTALERFKIYKSQKVLF